MVLADWMVVVTAAVMVYGALLSTYNFLAARRDRVHVLQVTLKCGLAAPGLEPETMFLLKAANPRPRPITLTHCGLLLPNRKTFVIPRPLGDATLPYELKEYSNCTFLFPIRQVVRGLHQEGYAGRIVLRAVFTDALGKEWLSKPFKGTVEEWAKAAKEV